jgi:hypothetical protein
MRTRTACFIGLVFVVGCAETSRTTSAPARAPAGAVSDDSGPPPEPKPAPCKPSEPPIEQLGKCDIVAGMGAVKLRVQECYERYRVPGLANVSMTIVRSGTVSRVSVMGPLSGTPTGSCIESVVSTAKFAEFTGHEQSINYPIMFRAAR